MTGDTWAMDPRDEECIGPECTRPARVRGWCLAHYRQYLRKRASALASGKRAPKLVPLRALRLGEARLVQLSVKVSRSCVAELDDVQPERSGTARLVLEAWAIRRRMERESDLCADPDPGPLLTPPI